MLTGKLDGKLGTLDGEGKELIQKLIAAKDEIISSYEQLNYAHAIRTIAAMADEANRYVDNKQPWATIKTDAETTRTTLTAVLNAVRILTIYLKPVLPKYAAKIERFLNVPSLNFSDVEKIIENHTIHQFERLVERVEKEKVDAMVDESKQEAAAMATSVKPLAEPIAPECTIEDFMRVDLRIATVVTAQKVEGADKLLQIQLDIGGVVKNVFAGISKAYQPDKLVGRKVVCVANLKPRKMKFGVSEGMILAAGPGDGSVFVLSPDEGAEAGQRVH
jgi:methionyl-tRNA synthetase